MNDFFEIDFLDVESPKSGDAIPLRYQVNGLTYIHVVDGGFQASGDSVVNHINTHYGNPTCIDHVVLTHSDGDHAGGLRKVLEEFTVFQLWMLRPWLYADELLPKFATYNSVENLKRRLKVIYSNIAALEEIAEEKGIPIYEPFQGAQIGKFTVLAPSKTRYLDLVVRSEKTPESVEEAQKSSFETFGEALARVARKAAVLIRGAWGEEVFSPEETSAENEMSVIQYANLCGKSILLTGDAGRAALTEGADFASLIGVNLPGIDKFQVPHHGARRNVSTETLDRWLGERLPSQPAKGQETFTAIISSAKEDEAHPRKAVVRALHHRGARVLTTEGASIVVKENIQLRVGWSPATPIDYPEEQEE